MIIDPHIAVIRTNGSTASYDAVMRRILARDRLPRGVLLHFAGVLNGELQIADSFADADAMSETFAQYTAPEAQNVMLETGAPFDLARDEYELERFVIDPAVADGSYRTGADGTIAAISNELAAMDLDGYHALLDQIGWFSDPPAGRLAHLAYNHGGQLRAIDFWESRAVGEPVYFERVLPEFERRFPGQLGNGLFESSWIDVRGFLAMPPGDAVGYDFTRPRSGPLETGA